MLTPGDVGNPSSECKLPQLTLQRTHVLLGFPVPISEIALNPKDKIPN